MRGGLSKALLDGEGDDSFEDAIVLDGDGDDDTDGAADGELSLGNEDGDEDELFEEKNAFLDRLQSKEEERQREFR